VYIPFTLRKSQRSFRESKSAFWEQGGFKERYTLMVFGSFAVRPTAPTNCFLLLPKLHTSKITNASVLTASHTSIFGHCGVIGKLVPDINSTFRTKSKLGINSRYGVIATDYLKLLKDSNLNISIDWNTCQHPLNLKGTIVNLRWRPTCSMLKILPQQNFELN
jgi:hypothetical protein